jgi:hypothetical protein
VDVVVLFCLVHFVLSVEKNIYISSCRHFFFLSSSFFILFQKRKKKQRKYQRKKEEKKREKKKSMEEGYFDPFIMVDAEQPFGIRELLGHSRQ